MVLGGNNSWILQGADIQIWTLVIFNLLSFYLLGNCSARFSSLHYIQQQPNTSLLHRINFHPTHPICSPPVTPTLAAAGTLPAGGTVALARYVVTASTVQAVTGIPALQSVKSIRTGCRKQKVNPHKMLEISQQGRDASWWPFLANKMLHQCDSHLFRALPEQGSSSIWDLCSLWMFRYRTELGGSGAVAPGFCPRGGTHRAHRRFLASPGCTYRPR